MTDVFGNRAISSSAFIAVFYVDLTKLVQGSTQDIIDYFVFV